MREIIEEIKERIAKMPINANLFGAVDDLKYLVRKLEKEVDKQQVSDTSHHKWTNNQ